MLVLLLEIRMCESLQQARVSKLLDGRWNFVTRGCIVNCFMTSGVPPPSPPSQNPWSVYNHFWIWRIHGFKCWCTHFFLKAPRRQNPLSRVLRIFGALSGIWMYGPLYHIRPCSVIQRFSSNFPVRARFARQLLLSVLVKLLRLSVSLSVCCLHL